MRTCATCGIICDSQIGFYVEPKKVFWGGIRDGNVAYDEKKVFFFCSEGHRSAALTSDGNFGYEIQTDKWEKDGEE